MRQKRPGRDDLQYVRDLGLVAPDNPVRVANPIYREVIARVLAGAVEANVTAQPRAFVGRDGTLDLPGLLEEFAAFWRRTARSSPPASATTKPLPSWS